MKIIGIDYSLHNTSICISDDFKTFDFHAIYSPKTKIWAKNMESMAVNNFTFDIIDPKLFGKTENYTNDQRKRLLLQSFISDKAIEYIKSNIGDSKNILFAMEGQSFNSTNTTSLVDIANGTGILRYRILNEILNNEINKLFIFTPSELKNCIGAGGCDDKGKIFEKFIADPIIKEVKDSNFYKCVINHKSYIVGKKIEKEKTVVVNDIVEKVTIVKGIEKIKLVKVKRKEKVIDVSHEINSPFNDMIDAYLSVLKVNTLIVK